MPVTNKFKQETPVAHRMTKYERGDYIKVEFRDEATEVGEWMWVRVRVCDDAKQIVFGTLDNAPVNASGKLRVGTELAISYSQTLNR